MATVPNCCCLKGSAPYWSNPPFSIFDIRALSCSGLSARVPKCQKLKMVGYTSMPKCKALMGLAVKGLKSRKFSLYSPRVSFRQIVRVCVDLMNGKEARSLRTCWSYNKNTLHHRLKSLLEIKHQLTHYK